ncbi:MAG: endopeptidase La, partial [Clostridia bacterium]|nr:endopeptidase La [Clostridia bacterium]
MKNFTERIKKSRNCTIALRGVVLFPGATVSFEVSRKSSVNAFRYAYKNNEDVFFVTQKDSAVLSPGVDDLYNVGVLGKIDYYVKLPNGNYQLLVTGTSRAEISNLEFDGEKLIADVFVKKIRTSSEVSESEAKKKIWKALGDYIASYPFPSQDIVEKALRISDPDKLADFLASNFLTKTEDRQQALSIFDPIERLGFITSVFELQIEKHELSDEIQSKTNEAMMQNQREAFLREQMQTIKDELGIGDIGDEESEYEAMINSRELPDNVREQLLKAASKLKNMMFGSAEGSVIKNYIEVCLELPWNKYTEDNKDIKEAKRVLEEDHDGITDVKERLLEFMAVKQLNNDLDGQIICLVGPPGVGKTSVVKSIARALGRKYVRISLGGIRDEAEIRGHRKTYIGSMPGRIINGLKLAGSSNPVMLLDEIDKLTKDAHGDPASAVLEVLDSEQNKAFRDHFIEMPVDLSQVIFIATANTTETIPAPLLDRMEIINMEMYSDTEKLSIAKNHLIPKQVKKHGLTKKQIRFNDKAILYIMNSYTREAGVRNLEREIGSVCRKVAKDIVMNRADGIEEKCVRIDIKKVKELLGPEKFLEEKIYENGEVGVVNGLAWTASGGDMLRVEVLSMPGTGKLELTGSLGDVMKESA